MQKYTKYLTRCCFLLNRNVYPTTSKEFHRNAAAISFNFQHLNCSRNYSELKNVRKPMYAKSISNINELFTYVNEGKQIYLKLLLNVFPTINYETLTDEQVILLLEFCGKSVPDSSREVRNGVCQNIYESLLKSNKLTLDTCHKYITVCTENGVVLNFKEFLHILPCEPNETTYKLLLKNSCEKGHASQAFEILEAMKNACISADETVFNNLLLAQTIQGGLKAGESVLLTMKASQINQTSKTSLALLKACIIRSNQEEFDEVLGKYGGRFDEEELFELLECVGKTGNYSMLSKIISLSNQQEYSREFTLKLKDLCIHCVHMNQPESAMELYKNFVDSSTEQKYGFSLLKEMLHKDIAIDVIIRLAKEIRDLGFDEYALENVTGIALRHNYWNPAWVLLENLTIKRPHFFWSLLVDSYKQQGETGMMNTIKKITKMGVELDSETLQNFVFPFCDLSDPSFLLTKMQPLGFTVKELLSPLLIVLLKQNQLELAVKTCKAYNVAIEGDIFWRVLCSAWKTTHDTQAVGFLLQRYCESDQSEQDIVGWFLVKAFKNCRSSNDFHAFNNLLKFLHEQTLTIQSAAFETIQNMCLKLSDNRHKSQIIPSLDSLLSSNLNREELIAHPRNMNINELECHLLELQEKNMNTRGVLRRLIQLHSNLGNYKRVEELREKFTAVGSEETPGMKSSIMYNYVQSENVDEALKMYNELKAMDPNFVLDSFKTVDLAGLLIRNGRIVEAMDIMQKEIKPNKTENFPPNERNCRQLLASFKDDKQQLRMFNFLINNSLCKPTNRILGPLVRVHLDNGNLSKAVDTYVDLATKFNCTPLQLELVCAIIEEQNEELLKRVVEITEIIHGALGTQMLLIAAFAEKQMEKPLAKVLSNTEINIKYELSKRCQRWVNEKKLAPLETLAKVVKRLPPQIFDINIIYSSILKIYSLNNDIESAVSFYEKITEEDSGFISTTLKKELEILLKRSNYQIAQNV